MHKHHGRHNDPSHHAHILMYGTRGRHADGGAAAPSGNMAPNTPKYGTPHYKHGGKAHRRHHADGDMTGVSPVTGERSPDTIARRRGGRACHAAGDVVATPYRRGGKSRCHHADGDMINHSYGDKVEAMRRGGFKKKGRKHHDAGDLVATSSPQSPQQAPQPSQQNFNMSPEQFSQMMQQYKKNQSDASLQAMRNRPAPPERREPLKFWGHYARGGVGKVRKGMLSPNGKILKSYNRTHRPS